MVRVGQNVAQLDEARREKARRGAIGRVTRIKEVYRAGYLGGVWGIFGPTGFVGCSGWSEEQCDWRARAFNVAIAAIESVG